MRIYLALMLFYGSFIIEHIKLSNVKPRIGVQFLY